MERGEGRRLTEESEDGQSQDGEEDDGEVLEEACDQGAGEQGGDEEEEEAGEVFAGCGLAESSLFLAVGGLAWGLELGAISGAIVGVRASFGLSDSAIGLFVGVFAPGEVVGAWAGGIVGDRYGRRAAILGGNLVIVGSSLALAGSVRLPVLFAARFMSGVAAGCSYVAQISWGSEVVAPRRRGAVVSFYELAIAIGYLVSFGVYRSTMSRRNCWRLLFGLPAVPGTVQFLLCKLRAVESPIWLAKRGKKKRASLTRQVWEWRTPWAVMFVMVCLTFATGGFNLRLYALQIYKELGLSSRSAANMAVALGCVKLGTTALVIALVDTTGRRPMLLTSLVLTACAAFAVASSAASDGAAGRRLGVAACLVYTFAFQIGFGSLNFILLGELFPTELKGRLIATQQLAGALVKSGSQYLFALALGREKVAALFLAHGVVALVGLAFTALVFVETKGFDAYTIRSKLQATPAFRALCNHQRSDTVNSIELTGWSAPPEHDDHAEDDSPSSSFRSLGQARQLV